MSQEQKIRLQKILADCGVASRRKAEELIAQKQVKVNGRVAQVGDKADPKRDHITVAGQKIETSNRQKHYYILLHKPRGYVSTMSDERGRKCVAELVEDVPARVYPVGDVPSDSTPFYHGRAAGAVSSGDGNRREKDGTRRCPRDFSGTQPSGAGDRPA